MGRGRAKAKQTKVARQLKYNSGGFDVSRLSQELSGTSKEPEPANDEPFDDDDDPYAAYADYYADEDDEEQDVRSRRGA
jgi:hypothetical protein